MDKPEKKPVNIGYTSSGIPLVNWWVLLWLQYAVGLELTDRRIIDTLCVWVCQTAGLRIMLK
jgi:hypothetical protein